MTQTAPVFVHVRRAGARLAPDLLADLRKARWLANLLDAKWSIMGVRFGLDGIVGLVPVVGDSVLLVASLYPIYVALRHQLGADVVARMVVNVVIDYFGGLLPLAGDVFDVFFRANLRNVAILERAVARLHPDATSR